MHIFIRTSVFLLIAFGLSLALVSCGSSKASRVKTDAPDDYGLVEFPEHIFVNESENDRIGFNGHWSDGGSNYIVSYSKLKPESGEPMGSYLRMSTDAGASFGDEKILAELNPGFAGKSSAKFQISENTVRAVLGEEGRIYYSSSKNGLDGFSDPIRINDSDSVNNLPVSFAAVDKNKIVVVWGDLRDAQPRIYSSFSDDGGKTWSVDAPVDRGIGLRSQDQVQVAVGANGRVFAVWTDWRDERTLADIRFASSDDLGRSWTKSRKLNDDELPVWQIEPMIVANGNDISVLFSDFREDGAFSDRDWNIYAARSNNNGESWEPNNRINTEKKGRQGTGRVVHLGDGKYAVTYFSTENSIFGQHIMSISSNGLDTGEKSVQVTGIDDYTLPGFGELVALAGGKVALLVYKNNALENRKSIVYLSPGGKRLPEVQTDEPNRIEKIDFETGKEIFSDDFSGVLADKWSAKYGIWKIEDGFYTGLNTSVAADHNESTRYLSFAKLVEPKEFVMKGKFRLDEASHRTANIYFRSGPKREFVISNQFRYGSWLAVQDSGNEADANYVNGGIWTQEHIAQKAYSFRSGIWYHFELVVTDKQIDYIVDGERRFSARPENMLTPSSIGIGGSMNSPTHFDDISISEVKR